jgi:hypothetical protein
MGEHTDPGAAAAQAYSPRPLTDGERWTAQALYDLRRRGYRPTAWRRFLADSLARSRATRRAHPALAEQARRWGVTGGLAWLAACALASRRTDTRLPARAGLAWWLAVWQMLDWHLGMAEGGDGRPRERLSPADAVTLARFWLVPVLPAVRDSGPALAAVIALGGATDALDGHIARRYGRTRLGRDLDTTADLAFLIAAGTSTAAAGRLPTAAGWALTARHVSGLALSLTAVFGRARRPAIRARPWGGALRLAGLVLCAADRDHTGAPILVAGCCVPPRSTMRQRSIA